MTIENQTESVYKFMQSLQELMIDHQIEFLIDEAVVKIRKYNIEGEGDAFTLSPCNSGFSIRPTDVLISAGRLDW